MNRNHAFTLIELIITIAIIGILVALAAPSFFNLIKDSQRASAVNDLLADMTFAKSEAAQRGRTIGVCSNVSGDTCGTTAQWGSGWLVFEDTDANGARNGAEPVLRRAQGRTATLDISANKAAFRFRPFNRRLLVDAGSVFFCDSRDAGAATAKHSRRIAVAQGGRARVDDTPSALTTCL